MSRVPPNGATMLTLCGCAPNRFRGRRMASPFLILGRSLGRRPANWARSERNSGRCHDSQRGNAPLFGRGRGSTDAAIIATSSIRIARVTTGDSSETAQRLVINFLTTTISAPGRTHWPAAGYVSKTHVRHRDVHNSQPSLSLKHDAKKSRRSSIFTILPRVSHALRAGPIISFSKAAEPRLGKS